MTSAKAIELLIVEDNPNDLELTLRALDKCGSQPSLHVVNDGVEALDFLFCRGPYARRRAAPSPKVIFLDLKLPKVDGMEVLRQLKTHAETQWIPIVMLTSSQQERDIVGCYDLGVNSYIVKPVDFSQFTDAISQISHYWLRLNLPVR